MPELPEVQTIVNDLNAAGIPGRNIVATEVFWSRIIARSSPREFGERIRNQRIKVIRRRAKYIVFELSKDYLLVHLRMTGRFNLYQTHSERGKHEHVILRLDDSRELRYHDPRKFGRFFLLEDPKDVLASLGPEPLGDDFTPEVFGHALQPRQRQLKPLLLDQSFLAGLGNIYTDEALFEARLHPRRMASDLSKPEIRSLYHAIRKVLRQGIQNYGTTLGLGTGNFRSADRRGRNRKKLQVFHKTGQPCPRCGTPIERIIVGQRSTHFCPRCQKA